MSFEKIPHAHELRRGDPLSPLLFVVAMDVLSSLVIKVERFEVLRSLSGCLPLQRLSIYADDVVLFINPVEQDLAFFQEALRIFGEATGLHNNYAKSSAILIISDDTDTTRVAEALPWWMDKFPCKYLGL